MDYEEKYILMTEHSRRLTEVTRLLKSASENWRLKYESAIIQARKVNESTAIQARKANTLANKKESEIISLQLAIATLKQEFKEHKKNKHETLMAKGDVIRDLRKQLITESSLNLNLRRRIKKLESADPVPFSLRPSQKTRSIRTLTS
jgi:hypothetical protein